MSPSHPPRFAYRLLRRFLPPGPAGETILGDLHDEYGSYRPKSLRGVWYVWVALKLSLGFMFHRDVGPAPGVQAFGRGVQRDLRYAFRSLLRRPSYVVIAVATLALGIGATTAVFSIIHGALLRPLPYRQPDRLLRIADRRVESTPDAFSSMSAANLLDIRVGVTGFEGIVAYRHWWYNLSGDGGQRVPARVAGVRVEPGFFGLLGVDLLRGRSFRREDGESGAVPVVVIDHAIWSSRFGRDEAIIGKKISLDLVPHVVIGVLPARFAFLRDPQVWVPFSLSDPAFERREQRHLNALARLAPGVSPEAGLSELQAVFEDLVQEFPEANRGWTITGLPARQWRIGDDRRRLWLFGSAVFLVLMIACVNVVNLTLVRSQARRGELGIRVALGAGRMGLIRLLVLESLVLSVLAGGVGSLFARWAIEVALRLYSRAIPRVEEIEVDYQVLALAIGLSLVIGLGVGLFSALRLSNGSLRAALKGVGRDSGRHSGNLGEGLVVAEVVLAVVLVSAAGLLIHSFWRLEAVDLGVDSQRGLTFALGLPAARYDTPDSMLSFWDALVSNLESLPGVKAVGLSTRAPLTGGTNSLMVVDHGESESARLAEVRAVNPGYFRALGIQLRSGRMPGRSDRGPGPVKVVVNEAFAREMLGAGDALGRTLRPSWWDESFEIVGVVSDVRDFGPEREPRPTVYWPVGPPPFGISAYLTATLRTEGGLSTILPAVRERLRELDPDLPITDVASLEELAARGLGGDRRAALSLLGTFAVFSLVLGAVGIYGVMSYAVTQRRRELGVRLALGASYQSILGLVLARGVRLTALGIAIGSALALASGRLLSGLLFEVEPTDPLNLGLVALILLLTALVACWVPAWRAARVEALEAIRSD